MTNGFTGSNGKEMKPIVMPLPITKTKKESRIHKYHFSTKKG